MITGGAEAPITKMSVAGFCANTALSFNPDPKQQADHLMQIVMALLLEREQELLYLKN